MTQRCPLCLKFVGEWSGESIYWFNKRWHYKCMKKFRKAAKIVFAE